MGFSNLSISRKLMVIISVTSSVVLLLATTTFIAYDAYTFRHRMARELTLLGELMEVDAARWLVEDDPATAQRLLGALSTQPQLVSALSCSIPRMRRSPGTGGTARNQVPCRQAAWGSTSNPPS